MRFEDNKIYLKEAKTNKEAYIIPIVGFGIACISFIFRELSRENSPLTVRNLILFACGCIVIFVIRTFSSDNSTIYVDISKKEIIFKNGKKETKIEHEKIKRIVIVKKSEKAYAVDIYDNELNAYECLNLENYEHIVQMAQSLGDEINRKVEDKTYELDYEGFRCRRI